MEIICCPATVQFGIQLYILAVHLNSFRVEEYGVTSFFVPVFFVTFFDVHRIKFAFVVVVVALLNTK